LQTNFKAEHRRLGSDCQGTKKKEKEEKQDYLLREKGVGKV